MDANTDYGTPYDYEFYVNNQGESFVGYQLEWALVLAEGIDNIEKLQPALVPLKLTTHYLLP
jgi:hypothetical protein